MVSQPYAYRRAALTEPDWRRFPGWSQVTTAEWESVQWQRAHCVKNLRQLRDVAGPGLEESFLADLERDQQERATMSMLVTPQMVNTMVPAGAPDQPGFTEAFYADPVRRYMIPVFSERRTDWPSHPYASRCTRRRCGRWKGSPTATRPRCWPRCCPPARSTAGTAPGWTWSAIRRPASPSTSSGCRPPTGSPP